MENSPQQKSVEFQPNVMVFGKVARIGGVCGIGLASCRELANGVTTG
jgi:hypothetical protein